MYQSLFSDVRLHGRASSGSYNDAENAVATKGRKSIDGEVRPRRIDNTAQSMSSRGSSSNFLIQSTAAICIILLSALSQSRQCLPAKKNGYSRKILRGSRFVLFIVIYLIRERDQLMGVLRCRKFIDNHCLCRRFATDINETIRSRFREVFAITFATVETINEIFQ